MASLSFHSEDEARQYAKDNGIADASIATLEVPDYYGRPINVDVVTENIVHEGVSWVLLNDELLLAPVEKGKSK